MPPRAAALPALLLLLAPALSGCLDEPGAEPATDLGALEVYRFVYPGAEKAVPGAEHGWLFRLANPGDRDLSLHVGLLGAQGRVGPATASGWDTAPSPPSRPGDARDAVWGGTVTVPAGGSVALLASVSSYGDGTPALLLSASGAAREVPVPVGDDVAGPAVEPGDHVRTVTVGVWLNGTSFYTNSPSLLDDPGFPAGGNVDRAAARAEAEPLALYVYDADRTEQPNRSRDACRGTTIPGYNDLLKSQVTGSTGVRFLEPEEAYTRAGAEDHLLYGDAIVFLNTVVAHDGATGPTDAAPDPTAGCFDPERYGVPPVPPVGA